MTKTRQIIICLYLQYENLFDLVITSFFFIADFFMFTPIYLVVDTTYTMTQKDGLMDDRVKLHFWLGKAW